MSKAKQANEFLTKLADLCEEYNAGFSYDNNDCGVSITLDGEVVFCDFIDEDTVKLLREGTYE